MVLMGALMRKRGSGKEGGEFVKSEFEESAGDERGDREKFSYSCSKNS